MDAGTFIILGYPGEKRSDIRETIRHLSDSDPSQYTITIAYPITGTPLFEEVRDTISAPANWEMITDRDYEFNRGKSRRYYEHALSWVTNEVNARKAASMVSKLKFKTRSLFAQAGMMLS